MCYPGVPNLVILSKWMIALQAPMDEAETVVIRRHASTAAVGDQAVVAGGGGGSGGGSVKQCVCSPTQHPGSFRCRQHSRGYVWGGRLLLRDGSRN
ncbi:hypothetical protein I3842_04G163900 [Carya illinoinensis]|uniref:Uncharacterized protein n=1 Tax=Carya illinoinensis TaxID=32201 RepID=A0A922FDB4_CARIL|nr:hypothetical protein I3842_04G163900 [Carya illinoinensis]